jgi:serine/threonine protein kinase
MGTAGHRGNDRFGLVGTTLASRYRVEEVVEETGFSVVYRAVHRVWKRPVAIKAFKAQAVGEDARRALLAAFVREGAVLAELSEQTAAVCQARDVASVTTRSGEWVPYMVLEWLDGKPLDVVLLREQLDGRPPRTVDEAKALLAPIARAVAVAHARGIVHRDIKPGNVCLLVDGAQRAAGPTKLLDFGTAIVAREASALGERAAVNAFTPAYGAPEQFDADYGEIGPWTDVFALALVFVELVTGRAPLEGENIAQFALRACDPARRPTPRARGVDAGWAVEQILVRALAVRPSDRFPNAGTFWSALTRAASQREELAETTGAFLLVRRRRVTRLAS